MVRRVQAAVGGHNAWLDIYGLMSLSKLRFFSPALRETLADHVPYDDLGLNLERMRALAPAQPRAVPGRRASTCPGCCCNAKGDRVAMNSSVETRYPFLDEEVFAFLARLHPRWKLRGLRDKYLLRLLAERWLPRRSPGGARPCSGRPFDSFHLEQRCRPSWISCSARSRCGRPATSTRRRCSHWRQAFRSMRPGRSQRTSIEMGLVGVVATQLWHHTFIDGSLADLPSVGEPRSMRQ